jgi:predicted outer membrane repeat protein
MINCIINGNSAKEGGGIYFDESSAFSNLTNCTVVRNTATANGGGLYCKNTSPKIINSILWEDSPQEVYNEGTGDPTITYSDVYGGYAGTGNIDAHPLFVSTAQQDYHLKVGSPCVDVGDNTAPELPSQDKDGNA